MSNVPSVPPQDQQFNPPPAPPPPPQGQLEMDKDARNWGMFAHLSALSGYVIPLGWIIGPIVVWMMKKEEFPFVNRQGKESLNWQLTMLIGFVVSIPLMLICVGIFTMVAVGILDLIFTIIAGIEASKGKDYKYPWSIKFIK